MAKNNNQLDLCHPCMEAIKRAYPLVQVGAGINRKITCRNCGRRCYGGAYKIAVKTAKSPTASPRRKEAAQ